jgi:hypothetical protein
VENAALRSSANRADARSALKQIPGSQRFKTAEERGGKPSNTKCDPGATRAVRDRSVADAAPAADLPGSPQVELGLAETVMLENERAAQGSASVLWPSEEVRRQRSFFPWAAALSSVFDGRCPPRKRASSSRPSSHGVSRDGAMRKRCPKRIDVKQAPGHGRTSISEMLRGGKPAT